MWQAITAAFGLGTSANNGAQAQLAAQAAANASDLSYTRTKNLTYYQAYEEQQKALLILGIVGFIFIIAILFVASRKK